MPVEKVSDSFLNYYLISFDAQGKERNEPDGTKLSEQILNVLANEPITDVFIMSHGWMGDVPAARDQYNKWIGAMAQQKADLDKIKKAQPGFYPLIMGLHWPSKPWGNEDLTSGSVSFDANAEDPVEQLLNEYAERIADTEAARQALQTILRSAMEDGASDTLPPDVLHAYQVLNQEANLGSEGLGGAPGSDWEGFDPEALYEASKEESVSFSIGSAISDAVLAPLRVLSFWKMKDRARKIGENAGFNLLKALQEKAAPTVRFHLMGHSFGCAVVSSILNGPNGKGTLVRPVDSVALVQGAVSLWSYCGQIAYEGNRPGYFHQILDQKKVAGPIITTQSEHDYAVGRMYPLASEMAPLFAVDFAPGQLPKYGGIGSFGLGGDDLAAENIKMLPADGAYHFKPGKIYNLESSQFIRDLGAGRFIGAHNDIAKPAVAHAAWAAAYPSVL